MNPALGLGVLRRRAAAAVRLPGGGAMRQARSYATKQPSPVVSSLFSPLLNIIHSLFGTDLWLVQQQAQFYKTFTRPIGKVLVLAVFTYQVAYWTWNKLEADEHRAEADGEQD